MVEIFFETGNGIGQVLWDFDFPISKLKSGLGKSKLPVK